MTQTAESLHVHVVDVDFLEVLGQGFFVELWNVSRSWHCAYIYQLGYRVFLQQTYEFC